jgi:hypothetical protein
VIRRVSRGDFRPAPLLLRNVPTMEDVRVSPSRDELGAGTGWADNVTMLAVPPDELTTRSSGPHRAGTNGLYYLATPIGEGILRSHAQP